jgi:foldase protein PrsA
MTLTRLVAAAGAAVLSAGALAACGSDNVPGDSVVRVGDTTIKNSTFDHWMTVAAISAKGQADPTAAAKGITPKVSIPEPPDFKACVADKAKTAPKPAKGQPKPTTAQFKTQCKTEYEGLRDQVLQFLITAQWIDNEAGEQSVKLTDKEVNKAFQTTKKQNFPKEADFQKFLKSSGMTMKDLLFRVRLNTLSDKLREKVTKGKDKVTPAQITAYFNKNKTRFAQPERRDLRLVLTKTEAKAKEARAAIAAGGSWKTIAKKYSIDQATKDQGGTALAWAKGNQEKSLDEAVFSAAKGKLSGPVKTQFGYYVFKVQKITKASQQTLKQASPTIKQTLASENQQKALDRFVKDFQKQWKGETKCRKGFVVSDCGNAPKPKASTTPTAPAQQAPAQQAPPQDGQTVPVQQAPATTTGK